MHRKLSCDHLGFAGEMSAIFRIRSSENMSRQVVNAKKLSPSAIIPRKSSKYAAGFDLFAHEMVHIPARSSRNVKTGIALQIPEGYFGKISSRSGMAFRQSIFAFEGTVDADYRGEISVLLENRSENDDVCINKGDRVAQIVIIRIHESPQMEAVTELDNTERGAGGFGSTGI